MSSELRVGMSEGNLTHRPLAYNPEYRLGGVTALPTAPAPEDLPSVSLYFGKTPAQLQILVLRTLAGVGALTGTFAAIKGDAERIFTIPLTVLSVGGLLYLASTVKDYADPKELRAMQEKAEIQPLSDIIKEHGLENTVKYLLNVDARQQKFEDAHALHSLSDVLKSYSFATIKKYKLTNLRILRRCLINELRRISVCDLKESFVTTCKKEGLLSLTEGEGLIPFIHQAKSYKDEYLANCAAVDKKYPQRISKLLEKLDLQEKKLPEEAKQLEKTILQYGYRAAIEQAEKRLLADTLFTPKPVGERLCDYVDNTIQGRAVTEEAAAKTAQVWLKEQLTKIATKRNHIHEEGFGRKDETLFQNELTTLDSNYKTQLKNLQKNFSVRVNELFGLI